MARTNEKEAPKPTPKRVEAYGVRGMNSTRWRRIFRDADEMTDWVEKHDAVIFGTRDAD